MKTEELDKIINEAPQTIRELLGTLQPRIIEAAEAVLEESQDSESAKATVKVGISLSIDLNLAPVAWKVDASVGVRHKVSSEPEVADTSPELIENMGKGVRKA